MTGFEKIICAYTEKLLMALFISVEL